MAAVVSVFLSVVDFSSTSLVTSSVVHTRGAFVDELLDIVLMFISSVV